MSKQAEAVIAWRKRSKARIVEAFGGSCCLCNYNKCHRGLALHHLNSAKKDFSFGAIRANPKSWPKIVKELRKCILVCHNCHSEIHEGLTTIPKNIVKFNEEYSEYTFYKGKTYIKSEYCPYKKLETSPCKICGQDKPKKQKYCSRICKTKANQKVKWETVDLLELLKHKNHCEIGRELGVSETTIRKRKLKLFNIPG